MSPEIRSSNLDSAEGNLLLQVEALLTKTEKAMPPPHSSTKKHEAFLEETKSLLHPGNYQVIRG